MSGAINMVMSLLGSDFDWATRMNPYDEEWLAVEKAAAAAELRMELEEAVKKGWLYAEDDENGQRRYGLTEEDKRAMERGELG